MFVIYDKTRCNFFNCNLLLSSYYPKKSIHLAISSLGKSSLNTVFNQSKIIVFRFFLNNINNLYSCWLITFCEIII